MEFSLSLPVLDVLPEAHLSLIADFIDAEHNNYEQRIADANGQKKIKQNNQSFAHFPYLLSIFIMSLWAIAIAHLSQKMYFPCVLHLAQDFSIFLLASARLVAPYW
jgi:hypothetical protein